MSITIYVLLPLRSAAKSQLPTLHFHQWISLASFFLLGKKKLVNEVIRHFGIVGEANIQYALDPYSKRPFPALSLGVFRGVHLP